MFVCLLSDDYVCVCVQVPPDKFTFVFIVDGAVCVSESEMYEPKTVSSRMSDVRGGLCACSHLPSLLYVFAGAFVC